MSLSQKKLKAEMVIFRGSFKKELTLRDKRNQELKEPKKFKASKSPKIPKNKRLEGIG